MSGLYRLTKTQMVEGSMHAMNGGTYMGHLVPVTVDREAIQELVTSAVRLGNNMAAYNSGMGDDEIEAEGKDFADEIIAALGGDDGTTTG